MSKTNQTYYVYQIYVDAANFEGVRIDVIDGVINAKIIVAGTGCVRDFKSQAATLIESIKIIADGGAE